jgi:putative transposase
MGEEGGRGRKGGMTRDREHDRRSIRLHGYDYSLPGAYFVTTCTQGRSCLFGETKDG